MLMMKTKLFQGKFKLLIEIPSKYPTRRGVDLLSRKFDNKLVFVVRKRDNKYFYTYGIGKTLKEKLRQYNLDEEIERYIISQIKILPDSTIGGKIIKGGGTIKNINSLTNVLKQIDKHIDGSLPVN